jgi:hypothetical protein
MVASTRFLPRLSAFGLFVVVGLSVQTDTTRHVYGYGGILPVPPAATDDDEATAPTPDILGQRRSTMRTEKGRVLYAKERVSAPAGADAARPISSASRAKRPCSQVVQTRNTAGAPNS